MTPHFTVDKRSLGVTFPHSGQAHVLVWAPLPEQVGIKRVGGSETLPLQQADLGYWSLTTDQIRPGDWYTLVLNGEREYADPASLSQPEEVHGPSEALDLTLFGWDDQNWVNPPLESYLLYEIHTGTFTPEGTFSATEKKLDYLKALGINAIEIMPVAQFADSRNWGYDGVYMHAVQKSYGGAKGLQSLVNACHQRGIAVVLDVVYNHFGPQGCYLGEFGPYLTSKYCTPWGNAVNVDDAWCDGVRHFVIENALMWFRDFHIDALRLDAVHAIKDSGPVHILQELRQEVDQLMALTGRQHYLLAECDLNDPRFINPLTKGGYGMDAQWMDEFHHTLRVAVGEDRTGYYADFDGISHLAKAYQDGYVYDGQFSAVRHKLFGQKAEANPGSQFIVFSQNHDQVGNRAGSERSSQLYSFNTLKLLAGAVLVSPYIPLLFMGEEWGETNPFNYFVSHSDPDLLEAVRQGRKEEFASFHSDKEAADPATEETFEQTKLQWNLLAQEPHRTLLRYYQTLIALRQKLPALHILNRQQVEVDVCDDQQTLVLHRWHEDCHVLGVFNFSKEPQSITLTTVGTEAPWQKLLDSAAESWQEDHQPVPNAAPDTWSDSASVSVPAESVLLYAQGHERFGVQPPDPIQPRDELTE